MTTEQLVIALTKILIITTVVIWVLWDLYVAAVPTSRLGRTPRRLGGDRRPSGEVAVECGLGRLHGARRRPARPGRLVGDG
jgi:hypothetical protein